MIIEPFIRRFTVLKSSGNHIQYVLDIGAYRGDFTETIKVVWPTAIVRQIEADDRQAQYLDSTAIIALLGDTLNDSIDFFTLPEDKITTGSSIFRELTTHYAGEHAVILKKSMTTLDTLDSIYNFYGNWRDHGLLKIDTQGSELLILEGATKFLTNRAPKYILLECSITQYNANSPRIAEVVTQMHNYNYIIKDVYDLSYDRAGNLLQTDILFERAN